MLIKDIGEFNLIKRVSAGIGRVHRPVIAGIGDDTAVLTSPTGKLLLMTTDMLVENVHFRLDTATAFQIGWKSLAVNISDIAAMGGEPTYAFVSIGLPRQTDVEFVDELYSGMREIAGIYCVDIIGGDTVSSPQVIINISLMGESDAGKCILRSGAKTGDIIGVTGDLGGSSAGLDILTSKLPIEGTEKHLMPVPRVNEGRMLALSGYVNSMIDVSDGLSSEVNHICEQSGTGARLYMKNIPLSHNVRQVAECTGRDPYDYALYGGEDYELLFTCQPDGFQVLADEMLKVFGTPLTCIGRIVNASESVIITDLSGNDLELKPCGYNHFTS